MDYRQTSEILEKPLILDRAKGLYYWDVEGNRYFDAIGGVFVALLGHRHPRILEAVRRQMDRMTFAPPLHGIAEITLDFVERLGSVAPEPLGFVKAFSGGSESTESAIKYARQYFKQTGSPGKYKFISCYGAYHGATAGSMAASGTGRRKTKFEPQMAGFLKVFSPLHYRDQFDSWEEANRFAARMFEDVIHAEDPDTVAGIIVEPISNTGGVVTPTDEYFRILREICDRYGILLIYDEVITGFARTGHMFAAQTFGVTPDILCAGKALSSGVMPLGSMIAREDMAEAFFGPVEGDVQFAHGHTYAGNPLACAVGIAVLDEIEEADLCNKAQQLGEHLAQKLEGLKSHGIVREIRGKGVFRGVELSVPLGPLLKNTAIQNGLILRIDPDWFAVCPALIAELSDIDEMVGRIDKSLDEALKLWEISEKNHARAS
jgi:adenosylmethionine-8-amino-7-oxononanoate aminotransferase